MTKNEKQQLETICRYLKDGYKFLTCGRTQAGVESIEKAEVLLDVLIALSEKNRTKK